MQRDPGLEQQPGRAYGGGLPQVGTNATTAARTKCSATDAERSGLFVEIDRMLRDGYADGGGAKTEVINAIVRAYPEVTRPMLWKRAQRLKLASSRPAFRKWNPAETRILMDFVNDVPIKSIAERLGRPLKSVLGKVRSLEMSARVTSGLSIRQAASDLQVSHHTVQRLVRGGKLVVDEDGRIVAESYRKYCQGLYPTVRNDAIPEELVAALLRNGSFKGALHSIRTTAALHLITSNGLSTTEVVSLVMSDVQWLDSGCARIQVRRGKTDNERVIIVSGASGTALREYRAIRPPTYTSDRFFLDNEGAPLMAQSLESALFGFGRAFGLPVPVSGRALRHAYAFRFLQRECRPGSNDAFFVLPKLSRLMGHYSPDTVLMYVGVLHAKTGGRRKKDPVAEDEDD